MDSITYISIATAIIVAAIALIVVFKTQILRETNSNTSPYSLSKFQLWLWTSVICPLFAIHWGWHFPLDPSINDTSLILLGIAGGVTLTSSILTQVSFANKRDKITKNIEKGLSAANKDLPKLKIEKESKGFWVDLLTGDGETMPVERLQNLIFTFVYVIVYVAFFFSLTKFIDPRTHEESMTLMNYINFDKLAFVLMGISSGSYLIGKGMNR
ncbi:hypothetical protein LZD49_34640 [Dyadobacter sp. CY261]|uniref:hypothetical protein n=1 Tax=Dyadobacter sp. CY261 TaxID=2907203 RepID=UPI001F34FD31|nr:hypothetical protein [Dyadobacter sp. CY261]MCF0075662.1 hypothetical protein [Dyadobacter sp. CY261]